jgi:hypothetical protein
MLKLPSSRTLIRFELGNIPQQACDLSTMPTRVGPDPPCPTYDIPTAVAAVTRDAAFPYFL